MGAIFASGPDWPLPLQSPSESFLAIGSSSWLGVLEMKPSDQLGPLRLIRAEGGQNGPGSSSKADVLPEGFYDWGAPKESRSEQLSSSGAWVWSEPAIPDACKGVAMLHKLSGKYDCSANKHSAPARLPGYSIHGVGHMSVYPNPYQKSNYKRPR